MDHHFHFNVFPKGSSPGYSTRIAFQDDMPPEEIIAAVAAETGLTVAQVSAAVTSTLRLVIIAGKTRRTVRRLV